MSKPALKDIAREAGVSITTVSFILNNKAKEMRISDKIIEKVQKVILLNNFTPNLLAQGLRTGKTNTLGLIVEDIGNNFYANLAKWIEIEALKLGYTIFFSSTENSDKRAVELVNKMIDQQVDGLIITPTKGLKNCLKKLDKMNKPFVLFDRFFPDFKTSYVVVDNFFGSYQLTKHLIEKGNTRIAFITILDGMNQMEHRFKGYKKALADYGIKYDERLVFKFPPIYAENIVTQTDILFHDIVSRIEDVQVLFFATNYLGIQGIEYFTKYKKSADLKFEMVCFDDHIVFSINQPPISVISQPINLMAKLSLDAILELINNGKHNMKQIKVEPELIIRN
jgi:LacI family transcriptional regulator